MTDTRVAERSAQLRDGRAATILRPAEITPRQRGGGARTIPMVSQQVGAKNFLNGITMFGPGAAIPEHFHNCDESVLILRGSAMAHIDRQTYPVGAGDASFIPAGIPHFFQRGTAHLLDICLHRRRPHHRGHRHHHPHRRRTRHQHCLGALCVVARSGSP